MYLQEASKVLCIGGLLHGVVVSHQGPSFEFPHIDPAQTPLYIKEGVPTPRDIQYILLHYNLTPVEMKGIGCEFKGYVYAYEKLTENVPQIALGMMLAMGLK